MNSKIYKRKPRKPSKALHSVLKSEIANTNINNNKDFTSAQIERAKQKARTDSKRSKIKDLLLYLLILVILSFAFWILMK